MERLLGDLDLLNDVRAAGFRGPKFDELVKALAEYGYQVLGSWIRTGMVFGKLAEKGKAHYLARYEKRIPPSFDAFEMTSDVVAEGIVGFRDEVLMPGVWDHRRGASLTTFFIGQCLLRFPKVYIEWLRSSRHNKLCVPPDELNRRQKPSESLYDDPAMIAVVRSRFEESRDLVPPQTRAILMLVEEGYSHPEIAQLLGISVGAIESRLHRHKKSCERRRLNDTA